MVIIFKLQKYQKFLKHVLAGKSNIEFSNWTDLNYHSEFVFGNPDTVLLNQLRNEQREGKLAPHNPLRQPKQGNINMTARAPNGSLSLFPRLPPLTIGDQPILFINDNSLNIFNKLVLLLLKLHFYNICSEGSSRRAIYATLMQELDSSTNVASTGLGSVNSHKAHTQNMGSIIGSSTSNFIHNLSYSTNHMDYYHQNPLAQEHENYSNSANTNMPLGGNHFTPPSKVHLENNFQSYQLVDVGEEDNNNFSHENNFHHDQLSQV